MNETNFESADDLWDESDPQSDDERVEGETRKQNGWKGWGLKNLDDLLCPTESAERPTSWNGTGLMEISGGKGVGKTVS